MKNKSLVEIIKIKKANDFETANREQKRAEQNGLHTILHYNLITGKIYIEIITKEALK